jgi:hypothetical protein
MAGSKETTILQDGFVKITNLRTLIGTVSYSMSDIRSVSLTKRPKNYKPLGLVIPGLLLISWSVIDQTGQFIEFFNVGIVLIVVSIALVLTAKPTYAVQIRRISGHHSILRSTDLTFIQRIVDAMSHVIKHRQG